jgi:hypothetical protein
VSALPMGSWEAESAPCLLLQTQRFLHKHKSFLMQDINTGLTEVTFFP